METQEQLSTIEDQALRAAAAVTGRRWAWRIGGVAAVATAGLFGGAVGAEERHTDRALDPVVNNASLAAHVADSDYQNDGGPRIARFDPQGKGCFAWGPPAPPTMPPAEVA